MARSLKLISATAFAVGASASVAQTPPRAVTSFVEGARACATIPATVEAAEAQLVGAGWPRATATTATGQSPANPNIRTFGRNGVMLMLAPPRPDAPAGATAGCAVYGTVEQMVAFSVLIEALTAALGAPPRQTRDTAALWILEGPRAAQLERVAGQPRVLMIFGTPGRPAQPSPAQ